MEDNLILQVWNKGQAVPGYDSSKYRKDQCGAWMTFSEYGNHHMNVTQILWAVPFTCFFEKYLFVGIPLGNKVSLPGQLHLERLDVSVFQVHLFFLLTMQRYCFPANYANIFS